MALASTIAAMSCARGAGQSRTGGASEDGVGGPGGATSSGVGQAASCTGADECVALADACNEGACVNGVCARLPDKAKENTPCEDGLYCTEHDSCHQGVCAAGAERVCPGADVCNAGACDEAARSCATTPSHDGQSCPSASLCESDTTCNGGVCGGGMARDCTVFDDLCSVGVCDPQTGCKPEQKSDGVPCGASQSSSCYGSVCQSGQCQKVAKDDGAACSLGVTNPCTVGVCQGAVCAEQPGHEGALCDDGLLNPCTQGVCTLGSCASGAGNEGAACDDGKFCTAGDHCASGSCMGDPITCGPATGCFVFQCNEAQHACSSVPGNDGASCDDGDVCTANTTCAGGVCGAGAPANEGGACVVSACTSGAVCAAGVCGGGQGPTLYLQEDFSGNAQGWHLGPEWQIGPAIMTSIGTNGSDPALDHTPSDDNGLAGVVIGGNESTALHPYSYLESPAFDAHAATGPLIFGYYRWLNSDYEPYVRNQVEVYNGSQWIVLWQSGPFPGVQDSPPAGQGWTYLSYDVSSYKSAAMKVRFGFSVGHSGAIPAGSWSVDDVLVASAACP